MALVDKLYQWLAEEPSPAADRVLAAALAHAEQPYFERLVRLLLERGQDASWAGLIGRYDRLAPELRRRLLAAPQRMRAGIMIALEAGEVAARCNALAALEDFGSPHLLFLLVDALRDRTPVVRERAAGLLRRTAAAVWDRALPDQSAAAGEYQAEREQLVKALGEALRRFEHHHRLEVVEAALWFAAEIGPALWEALGDPRSRCSHVVGANLDAWNHPRLAAFLLLALTRRAWRGPARSLLCRWQSPAELTALLRHSPLLDDPEVRRGLAGIRESPFLRLDAAMSGIPAALRHHVPHWVCCSAGKLDHKAKVVSEWALSHAGQVHASAVRALARLRCPAATESLRFIARSNLPLAAYARSVLSAREAGAEATSRAPVPTRAPPPEQPAPPAADPQRTSLTRLWQLCRRTAPRIGPEAIAGLAANLPRWQPYLATYLHSSDRRDRLLLLWMISAVSRPARFRSELVALADDPDPAVRSLAQSLLAALAARNPEPGAASPGCPPDQVAGTERRPAHPAHVLKAQQAALELLYRLPDDGAAGSEQQQIREFRALLELIHGQWRQAPAGAAGLAESGR